MKIRSLVSLLAVLAVAWVGVGCNTFKGIGKDVQAGGEVIEKAAESTQDAITR